LFESEFLTSTADSKDLYRKLIAQAAEIVCESFPNQPFSGKSPAALADFVSTDFLPKRQGSWEQIAGTVRTVVSNSVAVSNPQTSAHLHCPPLLATLAAEVVISALNQSMDSFDQAPIATVVEQKMIRWLCSETGLPAAADGTFTTGGSQSNYMGLLLARDAFLLKHWNWSARKSGLPPEGLRMRILCSDAAHFTVEKSASQLGLGTDAVVRIDVDKHFRIKPASLSSAMDALKRDGLLPMAIVATAGTTDFGSIDPLPEIAAFAREAHAWLHVDAAYGGALLFSAQHRHRLAGIENADSVAIDFHKLFWQPIPCSAFLVLDACRFDPIKLYADYLNPEFHEDEGIPNLVTTSLLTSRRFDALKLWISFQALGREKLAAMIDRTIALANHAATVIRGARDLELACEPQLSTVVFRYVPSRAESDTDRINTEIRQTLFHRGVAVIGHTRVRGRKYLKLTCMNPAATEADMEGLIELTRSQGRVCDGPKMTP
jgi:L-2,4-diaminobutyrate decarboxylase